MTPTHRLGEQRGRLGVTDADGRQLDVGALFIDKEWMVYMCVGQLLMLMPDRPTDQQQSTDPTNQHKT